MPPHILLQSTDEAKGDARLQPAAFRPTNQLPTKLPEGAHRVIKELTAAKMRSMMQGIVVEGTGKAAQLNGYSSGGKTGTAQKIDPATHTYSHTKLVASFAGIAPVSSPAISVAVVIDTPTVGSLYGATVSAPVFQSVAQQVLEYLGVPHDQPVKTAKQLIEASQQEMPSEGPSEHVGDLNAFFDAVNNLPADDPLRASASAAADASSTTEAEKNSHGVGLLSQQTIAAFKANGGTSLQDAATPLRAAELAPKIQARANGVVVDSGERVAVPSFAGQGVRTVIETAAAVGLRVEPVGSGIAREQVPKAGAMVPLGTQVVVRFTR
jgi:cell division protein FtsI (penicillin-binding protein 3)